MKKRPWIALFSQTGNEIRALSTIINRSPDFIIGNHETWNIPKINSGVAASTVYVENRPTVEDLTAIFDTFNNPIITLHGWLRIIPAKVCDKYDIYNGHPGLITEYPELRGFNKQEDIYYKKEKYPTIGSVIHRVTPKVDEGEILYACERKNTVKGINDAYRKLSETSFDTWIEFFKDENLQTLQNTKPGEWETIHWMYGKKHRRKI